MNEALEYMQAVIAWLGDLHFLVGLIWVAIHRVCFRRVMVIGDREAEWIGWPRWIVGVL